jgi:hypothetical protein
MSTTTTDQNKGVTSQGLTRAYQKLFKSKEGKLILANLKEAFGTEHQAFQLRLADDTGKQAIFGYDPLHAAMKDGSRGVILHIESKINEVIEADNEKKKKATVSK